MIIRNDLEKYSLWEPLTVVNVFHPEDMGYRSANINVVDSGDQLGRTVADYGTGNVQCCTRGRRSERRVSSRRNDFMTVMPVLISLTANWWQ